MAYVIQLCGLYSILVFYSSGRITRFYKALKCFINNGSIFEVVLGIRPVTEQEKQMLIGQQLRLGVVNVSVQHPLLQNISILMLTAIQWWLPIQLMKIT